jgi:hypothetical protein
MVYKAIIAISLLFSPFLLLADSAEDYFHRGAQYYVFGEKAKAKDEIQTGLKLYPDDVYLQKIAGLLKKEEKKDEQQKQNQQQKDQQQSQQNQDQSKSGQNSQSNSQAKQKSEQEKQQEQQQRDQQAQNDKSNPDKQQQDASKQQPQPGDQDKEKSAEEAKREAAMMAAGQMTPRQAKQLLDSQKDDEHVFQLAPPNKNTSQSRPFKNW